MSSPTGPGPQGQQGQTHQAEPGPTTTGPTTTGPTTAAPGGTPAQTGSTGTLGVVRIVLHVLALLLVVLGISLDLDDRGAMWSDTWAWAGFATLMALAQAAALLPRSATSGASWLIGAVGAGGLLLFWTLLMLPMISTNSAFLVTLGTACAVAGVLLSPDRRV